MLTKEKRITLLGKSKINGEQVADFSASLAVSEASSSISTYIQNQSLYEQNKRQVRKDMIEFRQYVFDQEDALFLESEKNGDDLGDTQTTPKNVVAAAKTDESTATKSQSESTE